MTPSRGRARRLLLTAMHRAGGLWLWRLWRRKAVIILTVHGVVDGTAAHQWRPMRRRLPLPQLERTLQILGRHYHFTSIGQAIEMLAGQRPLQPRSIVLTFDDGYRSQVTEVRALLARYGVPAVIFVSTGQVQTRQPFWFDRLDYALQHSTLNGRPITVGSRQLTFDGQGHADLTAFFERIRQAAKAVPRDDREMCRELTGLASDLEAASGRALANILESDPLSAPLTSNDIREAEEAFTFGSHTVDHLRINKLPPDAAIDQLTRSKADLERWTGKPCRSFCYPDGGVSREAATLVRSCGYEAAVTTTRGVNEVGDDLMTLRRIDVPLEASAAEMLAQLSGFTDWLWSVRRRT